MHWFDTREGKLIVGAAAYESVIEQSGPGDIVPLADLITSDTDDLEVEYYDRPPFRRKFTREELETFGGWILNVLKQLPDPPELQFRHLDNSGRLGLTPARNPFKRMFGDSIWQISEGLGAKRNYTGVGIYDDWTQEQFLENAAELAKLIGRPTREEYFQWAADGNGPSPVVVERIAGLTTTALNEMIGYSDPKNWGQDRIIDWGQEVLRVNQIETLPRIIIDIIAERQKGPSAFSIIRKFGALPNFRSKLYENESSSLAQTAEEANLSLHTTLLDQYLGDTSPESPEEKLSLAARFELARTCLKVLKNSEYAEIARKSTADTIVAMIINENYHLSKRQIVETSKSIGCYGYIWGKVDILSPLYVSPIEIEKTRAANTERKRVWRQTKVS